MRQERSWNMAAAVLAAAWVVLAGCGDAETADKRGYTKAPLEQPGLIIKPEPTTEMDRLGDPTLPVAEELEVEAEAEATPAPPVQGGRS
ncbi:MAG: hypothetical protein HY703_10290 [Gemmatimonadetes bacterium]|nr:hypothetical protein [Gemmatimonadota bacterium]